MSNPDSFVDEVSEELRRDRASRLLRRWGWLAVVAVVAVVGAAVFIEWRHADRAARAQAFGDALNAALATDPALRADALSEVPAATVAHVALRGLLRAAALVEVGDREAAAEVLLDVAAVEGLDPRHADLARVKAMLAGGTGDAATDRAILDGLARPGAPYRAVAVEVQAMRALAEGDSATAVDRLRVLTEEAGVGDGPRRRARALLLALGEGPDAS